jgi:hypothetical protein
MFARCFPTTTEVVVTSSLTKPRTLISTGFSVSNSKYTGARVPNRVPVDRLAGAVREAVNPATMRVSEWRDPDSNRGHHDFQSWSRISLTAAKLLEPHGFRVLARIVAMFAKCGRLSRIWALGRAPVPNRLAGTTTWTLTRDPYEYELADEARTPGPLRIAAMPRPRNRGSQLSRLLAEVESAPPAAADVVAAISVKRSVARLRPPDRRLQRPGPHPTWLPSRPRNGPIACHLPAHHRARRSTRSRCR